jgi:hypothetical protein
MTPRNRKLVIALAIAGSYIAASLALKAAEKAGFASHEVVGRALGVITGLGLAVYANFMPKMLGAFRSRDSAMRMEQMLRVGGWVFMLGGLGYALAYLLPVPYTVAIAVLGSATAYMLGYSLWAVMEHSGRKGGPSGRGA